MRFNFIKRRSHDIISEYRKTARAQLNTVYQASVRIISQLENMRIRNEPNPENYLQALIDLYNAYRAVNNLRETCRLANDSKKDHKLSNVMWNLYVAFLTLQMPIKTDAEAIVDYVRTKINRPHNAFEKVFPQYFESGLSYDDLERAIEENRRRGFFPDFEKLYNTDRQTAVWEARKRITGAGRAMLEALKGLEKLGAKLPKQ
ncbi:MAG: hypothetical protein QXH92_02105 [Candidatus Aenigmatarchaeota archaeon]